MLACLRCRTLLILFLLSLVFSPARAQIGDSTPSQIYFAGIEELYRGDYRDAGRTFQRELRGAIKTVNARWIDSICYHGYLGETFYQQGQPGLALEQFNLAASLYLQYSGWLLDVDFQRDPQVDRSLLRRFPPWGKSTRQFTPGQFPTTMRIGMGGFDVEQVRREGGVVSPRQLWPINAVEVLRCTALVMRRRNEILGPLGPYDDISKQMLARLSRGGAPPNHWSNAWIDILRGIGHAGVGEHKQAMQRLERGTLVAGKFDHPLTGVALLEQGRLLIAEGADPVQATALLAEASFSGFLYEDLNVIDEAFRLAHVSRIASGATDVNPALALASVWARQKRYDHIHARLQLLLAEELLDQRNLDGAAVALKTAQGKLRRGAAGGILANWSLYLEARLEYLTGRSTAPGKLANAVEGRANISLRNFQIKLANDRFDSRALTTRNAVAVYAELLRDPTPADTIFLPLDTLAVLRAPHEPAFQRWLAAHLERKERDAALEVADLSKRRRFHRLLPWLGRLSSIRNLLATPKESLSPERRLQQNDLQVRVPKLAAIERKAASARDELDKLWQPVMEKQALSQAASLWKGYSTAVAAREAELQTLSLQRIPADYVFPPTLDSKLMQSKLRPGQAVVAFHETPAGMIGFLFTRSASTQWNCGLTGRLTGPIKKFLEDLGNYDGNRELTTEQLKSDAWKQSGAKLYAALFEGSSFDPASTNELVIIPDGPLWYVPFEALSASSDDRTEALIDFSQVRYAPTAALAFSGEGTFRRVNRLGIKSGELLHDEKDDERAAVLEIFAESFERTITLNDTNAEAPLVGSLLDWLIVLEEVEADPADPVGWAPLRLGRSTSSLGQWMAIPDVGPQRIFLPGMRTLAENGGRPSRRKQASGAAGSELFMASCMLMEAGAETIFMSRWRVGGQTTLDATREFAQELPYASAADAWQRSVQILRTMPINPKAELRVKQERREVEIPEEPLTAEHPFFWAGYLVVDSGLPGPAVEDEVDEAEVAAKEKNTGL